MTVDMLALTSVCKSIRYIYLYSIITVLSTAYHHAILHFTWRKHSAASSLQWAASTYEVMKRLSTPGEEGVVDELHVQK